MKEPNDSNGNPKKDLKNPDNYLRTNPLIGTTILTQIELCVNKWEGKLYNPDDGRTYSCILSLQSNDTLQMRVYILGLKFLGKHQTWL